MPAKRDITIEIDGPHWLVITHDISGIAPDDLLRWFVVPELLTRWWSQEATVDPEPGGRWELRWPAMAWTLRGQIAGLTAASLTVSWAWEHEPDLTARALIVRTESTVDGSRLRLVQGPYQQGSAFPREDEDRASHIAGWRHFLPALTDAIANVPAMTHDGPGSR